MVAGEIENLAPVVDFLGLVKESGKELYDGAAGECLASSLEPSHRQMIIDR
jgi:hypothetical protein